MSWQLGSTLVLGLALAAGFAWYERTRPDARIVALVGTLAALAALGRIAFAAVPNVKPTTDIVLIAGYALGGGPGFAVGALAGLTSNFFFGQGPWTPWQMAGWGATGVLGAGLAVLVPRRLGRWPLAIVCGLAGFAFTVLQDVGDWVTYSDHSSRALGLYVGQGLGFDLVHAAGCVAFALAFGPALARSVERFARRLSIEWLAPGATSVLGLLVLTAGLAVGLSRPDRARASAGLAAPVAYLLRAQNADGGFGAAPGQASNPLYSGWAALGLAAAGDSPLRRARSGRTVLDYLRAAPAGDIGSAERTILVLRAAGVSAQAFGGRDLVAAVQRGRRGNGTFAGQVNLTAFAILALRSAGVSPGARSYAWLTGQQNSDGGFGFGTRGVLSDVDDTGAALEALAGAQGAARARMRAVDYLRGRQNRDGGFPSQPGQSSNAQSTAWAIQGLDAAGVAPASLHRAGSTPLGYLRSLIAPDGSVRYARGVTQTPVWVTGEALMALAGKPLPLAPVPAPPRAAVARRARRSPSRAATHHRSPSRGRHRRAHRGGPGALSPAARGSGALGRLSAQAGVLTALVLAPVGLG